MIHPVGIAAHGDDLLKTNLRWYNIEMGTRLNALHWRCDRELLRRGNVRLFPKDQMSEKNVLYSLKRPGSRPMNPMPEGDDMMARD